MTVEQGFRLPTQGLAIACANKVQPSRKPSYCTKCGQRLNSYNKSGRCSSSGPCRARVREAKKQAKAV